MKESISPTCADSSAAAPNLSLSLLNHASILIRHSCGISLLTDPWFSGYAFEQGWGLRFQNELAAELARTATHLWISHFHEDHMHMPTLKALHAVNPGIVVLANASFNFKIAAVARRIGFQNIIELGERRPIQLAGGFSVVRYPVTGIDNMLLIDAGGHRILNYNDCNLSAFAQKQLADKFGKVDILLSNFNHAGKLLHARKVSQTSIKKKLIENFRSNFEHFSPRVIIPFASHHYYRAPESASQNATMLEPADLRQLDARIVDLNVGDTIHYDAITDSHRVERGQCTANTLDVIERDQHRNVEELLDAGTTYANKLRSGHGALTRLLPGLGIDIVDLGKRAWFRPATGLTILPADSRRVANISCHSAVLYNWFTKPYGTDAFAVGAHFGMQSSSKGPLMALIAAGLLVENKLDVKSLLRGLFTMEGRQFLYNRREEILGILVSGKIFADYHKEEAEDTPIPPLEGGRRA
jgi:L-ascorbate metabolism protein UlaG (beta-lactamase superfamily)